MKQSSKWWLPLLSVVMLVGVVSVWARPEPAATQPADEMEKPAAKRTAKPVRLTQPWSLLTTLTDEQKAKIADIHAQANAERKAIEDKEESDIMALLTPEQKTELDKATAAKKAAAAEKRKAAKEEKGAEEKKKEE